MNNILLKSLVFFSLLSATLGFSKNCSNQLNKQITYWYNDGFTSIQSLIGPIYFNEGDIVNGNPIIRSMLGFAVNFSYKETEDGKIFYKNIFITAECLHTEPETLLDKNNDGIFDLRDTNTLGM